MRKSVVFLHFWIYKRAIICNNAELELRTNITNLHEENYKTIILKIAFAFCTAKSNNPYDKSFQNYDKGYQYPINVYL